MTLFAIIVSIVGIVFTTFLAFKVLEQPSGDEKMQKISKSIQVGAKAFLFSEYKILSIVLIILFLLLWYFLSLKTASAFLLGSLFSILSGYFGMSIATRANVRTANAAKESLNTALRISFNGGAVMGMTVASFGILGLGLIYFLTNGDSSIMSGYAMGASLVALFSRVGGGIYTKAADIGADLVGKTEAGIPEDDPRNPAVIADNVGDNVGDVAGMGADLYESYVGSIFSASVLGMLLYGKEASVFPFVIAAFGLISAMIGIIFVNLLSTGKKELHPSKYLNMGTYIAGIILLVIVFITSKIILNSFKGFWAVLLGMIVGTSIGAITEYYTAKSPIKGLADSSVSGTAPLIINGLALGMESVFLPVILISVATIISYKILGLYGISLAGVGMLANLGITLAIDAYGPIADNAGGIAQMAGLDPSVRERTDLLDSVGNTTAAIGKGFAIGSAALTALALFSSYISTSGVKMVELSQPRVFVGALIGGMLPFFFSSLAMKAVGQASNDMVKEVRRQFKEIVGLMEGKADPDYAKCVEIATKSALKHMVNPALLAILSPVLIFLFLGKEAVAGSLIGALVSGVMLAIFMANSGGAWDNAKKLIETGLHGGKGSLAHRATVIGDTVGDPLKDTAGPSINILIKLMSIVSIVFIPILSKIIK